jgi:hypothetical protein
MCPRHRIAVIGERDQMRDKLAGARSWLTSDQSPTTNGQSRPVVESESKLRGEFCRCGVRDTLCGTLLDAPYTKSSSRWTRGLRVLLTLARAVRRRRAHIDALADLRLPSSAVRPPHRPRCCESGTASSRFPFVAQPDGLLSPKCAANMWRR